MAVNRFIDVHTHLFNGYYVPIEEILYYWSPLPLSRGLARAFGQVIKDLIGTPLSEDDQRRVGWLGLRDLDAKPEVVARALVDAIERILAAEIKTSNIKDTAERARNSKMHQTVLSLVRESAVETNDPFDEQLFGDDIATAFTDTDDAALKALRLDALRSLMALLRKVIIRILESGEGQTAAFVLKMLSDDHVLFDEVLNHNYRPDDLPALTVHHTMDIEPAYWDKNLPLKTQPPEYLFPTQQIEESAEFIGMAGGRLLGFAAYHPARGTEALAICQRARKKGHIGVKIYPPLNYQPIYQTITSYDGSVSEDKYNQHLRELYRWCIAQDIPVMAHCTPKGFEAWKDTGFLSDPIHWAKVLGEFPDLRLCLGHAGGGDYDNIPCSDTGEIYASGTETTYTAGWYAPRSHWNQPGYLCYPREVVRLCRKYPNVFCDLSYLHAIMEDDDKKKRFIANLKWAMTQKTSSQYPYSFADKVMYGTDWHMMAMVRHTQQYRDLFKAIFADHDWLTDEMADKFFFGNAVRFLNLAGFIEAQDPGAPFFSQEALAHLQSLVNAAG